MASSRGGQLEARDLNAATHPVEFPPRLRVPYRSPTIRTDCSAVKAYAGPHQTGIAACDTVPVRLQPSIVWRASLLRCLLLCLAFAACTHPPGPSAVYDRNHDGHTDEWVYRIGDSEVKRAFDTNRDGKPDVIDTYRHGDLVKIEKDRNFDGRTDLVQKFDHGTLTQIARDDNFDGKPETIEIYRHGVLAMIEHDPDGCGVADSVDYYEGGRLIRTQVRKH